MIYEILSFVSSLIINVISDSGYLGVFVLMTLESALIPVPSEIIMPFSGFLASLGKFSFWQIVWWGTVGNLLGSLIAYFIGLYGGRPLVEKWGKYVMISRHDLEKAENWFKKYGSWSIFFSRLLPAVRTFISLPAGMARMPIFKFSLFTFLGSLPWSFLLAYVGLKTGENWVMLEKYFRKFDWLVLAILGLAIGWWLFRKLKVKS